MKMLGKGSMSSILKGFTTFILVNLMLSLGFIILEFIGVMIDPQLEIGAIRRSEAFHYRLTPHETIPPIEIERTATWITKPELALIGRLDFVPRRRWFHLVKFLSFFAGAALVLTCLLQLRRYYKSLSKGSPFVKENARRLKTIAWLTIGLGVANIIFGVIPFFYTSGVFSLKGYAVSSLYWLEFRELALRALIFQILEGFFILVIADVFRVGVALKEEQDLTV
jgi:hypothetical protein